MRALVVGYITNASREVYRNRRPAFLGLAMAMPVVFIWLKGVQIAFDYRNQARLIESLGEGVVRRIDDFSFALVVVGALMAHRVVRAYRIMFSETVGARGLLQSGAMREGMLSFIAIIWAYYLVEVWHTSGTFFWPPTPDAWNAWVAFVQWVEGFLNLYYNAALVVTLAMVIRTVNAIEAVCQYPSIGISEQWRNRAA